MNNNQLKKVKFHIKGRVQGVAYRANTKAVADKLKIAGNVKNLEDGSVQAVAIATEEVIEKFENWLKKGPFLAKVSSVERIFEECLCDENLVENLVSTGTDRDNFIIIK